MRTRPGLYLTFKLRAASFRMPELFEGVVPCTENQPTALNQFCLSPRSTFRFSRRILIVCGRRRGKVCFDGDVIIPRLHEFRHDHWAADPWMSLTPGEIPPLPVAPLLDFSYTFWYNTRERRPPMTATATKTTVQNVPTDRKALLEYFKTQEGTMDARKLWENAAGTHYRVNFRKDVTVGKRTEERIIATFTVVVHEGMVLPD
jgi:hypothetical protein